MFNLWSTIKDHLNFFRIHLLSFTFCPLIFSVIFYASNGQYHISYIDSLFNCVSAATVCGLATVDLSSLTGFQQALLFIQASLGTPVVVSWVMVYVRRRYFTEKLDFIVETEVRRRETEAEQRREEGMRQSTGRRVSQQLTPISETSSEDSSEVENRESNERRTGLFPKKSFRNLRPGMIRRTNDPPKRVSPNGLVYGASSRLPRAASDAVAEMQEHSEKEAQNRDCQPRAATVTDPGLIASPSNAPGQGPREPIQKRAPSLPRTSTFQNDHPRTDVPVGHTSTVEFVTPDRRMSRDLRQSFATDASMRQSRIPTGSRRYSMAGSNFVHDDRDYIPPGTVPLTPRHTTQHSQWSFRESDRDRSSKNRGYGGFPYPPELFIRLFKKLFPDQYRKLRRTVTLRNTQTISTHSTAGAGNPTARIVRYISFTAVVGRNSKFYNLTKENLEELGGLEYRALTVLLWLVAGYYFTLQLLGFVIIAPYMSTSQWRTNFEPPNVYRYIPPMWFSAFQVVNAFTGAGMSLMDQSMIPFQRAYPMIFVLLILFLAGTTAYPIFLRFTIWCVMKCVPGQSSLKETLCFVLDCPRRCFIYLFPSHQTWLLLTVVILSTTMSYFFFLVLDIGNVTMEAIPVGVRFAIGPLQACGFTTVKAIDLEPTVQALFMILMYVSIYPIAMSVRSTNVYEEQSLGVYVDDDDNDANEPSTEGPTSAVWGRYLVWHARRQLAFDMWWMCLALFLLCIIERFKIQDNPGWFTIFAISFEIVSAYSGCGLSLGLPHANYSFSGSFQPLSKLIICAIMLRGRHRGLPVAIDRAIMLPLEFKKAKHDVTDDDDHTSVINRIIDGDGEVRKKH